MSSVNPMLADSSAGFEPPAVGAAGYLDFHSIAGLMDAVLMTAPTRLTTLLRIIWKTDYKLEAREALRAAVACRDPLVELGALFRTAVSTMTDLERLALEPRWQSLESVVGRPVHATALLNACENEIEREEIGRKKRARLVAIHARLEAAASAERKRRGAEIKIQAQLRGVRFPYLWETLESWRDTE